VASQFRYDEPPSGRGRTIAVAAIATASGVAALFAYHTSPGQGDGLGSAPVAAAAPVAGDPAAAPQQAKPQDAASTGTTGNGTDTVQDGTGKVKGGTFTGAAVDTRWGVVQVKITVRDGKVVAASAPKSPRSTQYSIDVNKNAIPVLNQAAVAASSAAIDGVSGATVTSGGYKKSLQSALDQAHL
jgi:uncharacterized protein with FMN-binding domain